MCIFNVCACECVFLILTTTIAKFVVPVVLTTKFVYPITQVQQHNRLELTIADNNISIDTRQMDKLKTYMYDINNTNNRNNNKNNNHIKVKCKLNFVHTHTYAAAHTHSHIHCNLHLNDKLFSLINKDE